jgi:hypothetical protein
MPFNLVAQLHPEPTSRLRIMAAFLIIAEVGIITCGIMYAIRFWRSVFTIEYFRLASVGLASGIATICFVIAVAHFLFLLGYDF